MAAPSTGPAHDSSTSVHHVLRGITMGKALFGAHADPRSLELLDEVRSLRERVAELEQALQAAQAAAEDDAAAAATREHATT
jgi:hypothetical protein